MSVSNSDGCNHTVTKPCAAFDGAERVCKQCGAILKDGKRL